MIPFHFVVRVSRALATAELLESLLVLQLSVELECSCLWFLQTLEILALAERAHFGKINRSFFQRTVTKVM